MPPSVSFTHASFSLHLPSTNLIHPPLSVNPEISSGLPIPTLNRYPQPASRPERYATPATKASDIAFNPVSIGLGLSWGIRY